METINNVLSPFIELWNDLTVNPLIKNLKEFRGGNSLGNDYTSKMMYASEKQFQKETEDLIQKLYQKAQLQNFIKDNWINLLLLGGLDRLFSLRQGYGISSSRFYVGDSNIGALQTIMKNGVVRGYYRGFSAFAFQQCLINFHASQLSGDSWTYFILYSSIFRALLHPLDTVKTIYQADVSNKYKSYGDVIKNIKFEHYFRGMTNAVFYNIFFCINLKQMYDQSNWVFLSYPLWALSYVQLNFKSKMQISNTRLSYHNFSNIKHFYHALTTNIQSHLHYAGIVPFLAVNTLFMVQMPILYSKEKKEAILIERHQEFEHEFRQYSIKAEKKWA